jgi:uncharacterized damage-inducible protein DinB
MLYGKHAHVDPKNVLGALSPAIAKKRIPGYEKSAWELLYHMWYWQDMVIRAYKGDKEAESATDRDSWPKPEDMDSDEKLEKMKEDFSNDLEYLTRLAENEDLMKKLEVWSGSPLAHNLLIEIAHNSYHLGQIVVLLKANDAWPVSKR